MASLNHFDLHKLQDTVSSQWVWREELEDLLAAQLKIEREDVRAALLVLRLHRVRPLIWELHGSHTIFRAANEGSAVERLIKLQLRDYTASHCEDSLSAAHYSNFGFSIPSVVARIKRVNLGITAPDLSRWIATQGKYLDSRGLLEKEQSESGVEIQKPELVDGVLTYEQLKRVAGCRTRPELIAWLTASSIAYKSNHRSEPFTTLAAVNDALGIGGGDANMNRVISV